MIKLVLSDMDNTLIPFGRERVSQRTIDAIHACQEQGVDFGPATGRDRAELARFFGGDRSCYNTAVCVNGQKVYYLRSLVFERSLDDEPLRRAARYVQTQPGCAFVTYRSDGLGDWVGISREEMGSMYDRAFMAGGMWHETLPVYPVAKAGIICMGGQDAIDRLQAELEEDVPPVRLSQYGGQLDGRLDQGLDEGRGREGAHQDPAAVARRGLRLWRCRQRPHDALVHSQLVRDGQRERQREGHRRWHVGASADDGVAIALEQIAEAARLCNERGTEDILPAFMQEG